MHDDTGRPMSPAERAYYDALEAEAQLDEFIDQAENREPIEPIPLPSEATSELSEEYLRFTLELMIDRAVAGDQHVVADVLPSLSDALVKRLQLEARIATDNEKTSIARDVLSARAQEKRAKIHELDEKHGAEATHDVIAAAWKEAYPGTKVPSVSTISRARNAKK